MSPSPADGTCQACGQPIPAGTAVYVMTMDADDPMSGTTVALCRACGDLDAELEADRPS